MVGIKMDFYDQHMHTNLSFDSDEDPYNYISSDTKVVTFTEHLDLKNNANQGKDDIPDFDQLLEWKEEMAKIKGVQLLLGVEVGYVSEHKDQLLSILDAYDFDIKLLSCHQNEHYDYMDKIDLEPEMMIHAYLDQLLNALRDMPDCHIMAHFDYGFRIHKLSVKHLKPYEDKLKAIFKECIKQNMAFEINSKSLYVYDKYDLYEWAIPVYQELGGTLFSLGSDAHTADEHQLKFDQSIELLKKFDIKEVALFQKKEFKLMDVHLIDK